MSDYGPPPPPPNGDPVYPAPGDPPPPPPSAPGPARGAGLTARLGARVARRPEPKFTVALAGAGAALVLVGMAAWSGDYLGGADSPSTDRNLLGAGVGAAVTVLGYLLAYSRRVGPLATAGVVMAGLGLPFTLAFLTLDFTSISDGLPINFDVVFWVSVIAWAVSYLLLPGTAGHTFFVFLIANFFYTYILVKSASSTTTAVNLVVGNGPRFSGFGTIAAVGLVFGLAYYLIAFLLDRSGRHGPATGLIFVAFNATATGIIAWSTDLHLAGTAIVTIIIGLGVCWYGGTYGRRATCFTAAAAVFVGIVMLVFDVTEDGTKGGIAMLVIGAIVVAIAAALASGLGERDDMDTPEVVGTR